MSRCTTSHLSVRINRTGVLEWWDGLAESADPVARAGAAAVRAARARDRRRRSPMGVPARATAATPRPGRASAPAYEAAPVLRPASSVGYAELHAHSSFSFLDGASSPEELAEEAVRLGLTGLTLTDHDGMYGIVRFAEAAEALGLPTAFGAELSLDVALPGHPGRADDRGPGRRPRPAGHAPARPGPRPRPATPACAGPSARPSCAAARRAVRSTTSTSSPRPPTATGWCSPAAARARCGRRSSDGRGTFALDPARRALAELVDRFGRDNVAVELTHELDPLADERYDALATLADEAGLPIVATTAAHYHAPPRRPLATAMAAVRARSSLDEIDGWLPAWAGQHLRSGDEMAERFARWPGAVETAARLGEELAFPLHADRARPAAVPGPGRAHRDELPARAHLRRRRRALRRQAARAPRPTGRSSTSSAIIEELHFPGYFLVVWDIARFCREQRHPLPGPRLGRQLRGLLRAGRSPPSTPVYYDLMFERFLAPERGEPPDIDSTSSPTAARRPSSTSTSCTGASTPRRSPTSSPTGPSRRSATSPRRSATPPASRTPGARRSRWATTGRRRRTARRATRIASRRSDLTEVPPQAVVALAAELQNAPRHLGIHSGGMVMCDRPVIEVCPVEWGRMPGRTVLQWDKDDCAAIGLVKFDLLGLGMLSALQYCFELIESWHGVRYDLDAIPKEAAVRLRHALRGRLGRGVPGRVARADGDAAPAAAAQLLRPRDRGRADPARPDPGRLGASLHPAAARPRADHLPAPAAGRTAASARSASRCSRSS